ncbi:MAG: glucosamine-6-phosphate deaminase [Myxococcales bacterium]|jgi:glucosamine-6-phosphate deaminase
MEIIVRQTAEQGCQLAAAIIAELVRRRPDTVLGLATGSTPIGVYRELVRRHREEGLDFSRVTTFNLDEYVGLEPNHPLSYRRFMAEHLFDHVNTSGDRVHVPDGTVRDVALECQAFEDRIRRAGGIDLQLLGLGLNGHIAFNEPSSSLRSRTRVVTIAPSTAAANFGKLPADVPRPRRAITMGVGTILEARRLLLLAFGEQKAEVVAKVVEGPLTAFVPGSALQLHENATVILDEAAASRLVLRDYYRQAYDDASAARESR